MEILFSQFFLTALFPQYMIPCSNYSSLEWLSFNISLKDYSVY